MDKFVTRTKRQRTTDVLESPSVSSVPSSQVPPPSSNTDGTQVLPSIHAPTPQEQAASSTVQQDEFSIWNLQTDPAMRKPISSYHPNDQDKVRRAYMKMGPCQPKNFPFPQKLMGKKNPKNRRFNEACFLKHGSWLEYSISKDVVFCLPCYLFRNFVQSKGSSDAFVNAGFSNWKQFEKLDKHVGCHGSAHNDAYMKSRELLQETHHIQAIYHRQKEEESLSYMIRLTASICVIRFLLCQALAFRGHDESDASHNQGNFLELLKYTAEHNDSIKSEVMKNAPGNNKLTSPDIQKEIVSAGAMETMDAIRDDIGDAFFAVMVDESRDVSVREQMAVVIRYVNNKACVIERFIGIIHVLETTSISLKTSVDALFSKYGLNIMRLRGQCYDGASNMQGSTNGLKVLILRENPSAYVIHGFSHQLQLALMHVAQKHTEVALLFTIVSRVVTIVSASCKRRDVLREKELARVVELVEKGERLSGSGLNQEAGLKRPSDTRWGTHYNTLLSLILMFPSILDMLEIVSREGASEARGEAYSYLILMPTFDFVFTLFLVRTLLGITNELSQALQRKDQDIVNAMNLVKISKDQLQRMRDGGWDALLSEVSMFCAKNNIIVPDMMSTYVPLGRGRRNLQEVTNLHHYQVGYFFEVIDMQIDALNDRFDEVNTELLLCMSHLNPSDKFSSFDKGALIRLAELYPTDFSQMDIMILDRQLDTFLDDVISNDDFSELGGISVLAQKMVETKRNIVYPLVYLLITLSLILPVATAIVERVFSAMHIVKNRLRNRIGNEWLNNCLLTYIERELFRKISIDRIRQRFQDMNMKTVWLFWKSVVLYI